MELEWMLCQVVRLEVRSIRDWNSIEKKHVEKSLIFCWFWKSDVDLSTPNRCHSFHVDSLFIVDEISTNVWRGNSICWIHGELTKMRPLGNCSKYFNRICISFIFNFSKVNTLLQIYCVRLKSKTLCISLFSPSSSSRRLFRNIGEFGAKKYFSDHRTSNATQLFVAIKGNFFSSILFLNKSQRSGSSRDYLINRPTSLLIIYAALKYTLTGAQKPV